MNGWTWGVVIVGALFAMWKFQEGNWVLGSVMTAAVLLILVGTSLTEFFSDDEAKEERAEERRERLANEREMKRMELEHQQRNSAPVPLKRESDV